MITLIDSADSKLIANSRFVKNACFYKDMFVFFDAYKNITESNKQSLPNFCFLSSGQFCLDGICLLMKMYSSEFGFETLKLSLDYLRVLYFTIASFSEDGKTVKKSALEAEFNFSKQTSCEQAKKAQSQINKFEFEYEQEKSKHDNQTTTFAKKLVTAKILSTIAIILLVTGTVCAMIPFTFYFLESISLKIAIIVSVSLFLFTILVSVLFKVIGKKLEVSASDFEYSLQGVKKAKDKTYSTFKDAQANSNQVLSENYEYLNKFSDDLKKFVSPLSFDEITARAKQYNLLSYNIKYDVERLFNTQQNDISETISAISTIRANADQNKELLKIYNSIKEKDWLYYNNQIRFTFLKKFIETAHKTHQWSLDENNSRSMPFEINAKALANENIVYLKSKNDLFVESSIDTFLHTRYAKDLNAFNINKNASANHLISIKVGYINHFFNSEKVKQYNNLFYDKMINEGVKITDDILEGNNKIPTFVLMKIKLLENAIGLSNSDSDVVRQLADELFEHFDTAQTDPENDVHEIASTTESFLTQTLKDETVETEDAED